MIGSTRNKFPRASRVKSGIRVLWIAACITLVVTPRVYADITLVDRLSDAQAHTRAVAAAPTAGAPTLGNYPDTSMPLSTDTTITPDAAPGNTTSINVATSTDFKGTLEGDPTTGVVRVTGAHPAGTYTVTVTAFNGGDELLLVLARAVRAASSSCVSGYTRTR